MFRILQKKRIVHAGGMFNGHFIDVKAFYVMSFEKAPCVSFIGDLDVTRAFQHIQTQYKQQIQAIYQHNYFDHDQQKIMFNNTIFVLYDHRMIEVAGNYCQILHTDQQYRWANILINELAAFRVKPAPQEKRTIGFARQQDQDMN